MLVHRVVALVSHLVLKDTRMQKSTNDGRREETVETYHEEKTCPNKPIWYRVGGVFNTVGSNRGQGMAVRGLPVSGDPGQIKEMTTVPSSDVVEEQAVEPATHLMNHCGNSDKPTALDTHMTGGSHPYPFKTWLSNEKLPSAISVCQVS